MKKFIFVFVGVMGLVLAQQLFADTLEERVTKLEKDVAELKRGTSVNQDGIALTGTRYFKISNKCDDIVPLGDSRLTDNYFFTTLQTITCPQGEFYLVIVYSKSNPATQWLDMFNKNDLWLFEKN